VAAGGRATAEPAWRGTQAMHTGTSWTMLKPWHLLRPSGGRGRRGQQGWWPAGASSCVTRHTSAAAHSEGAQLEE